MVQVILLADHRRTIQTKETNKMAIKDNREYRKAQLFECRASETEESYIVEGYATTFDDEYVLFEDPWDGTQYKEKVMREAFDKDTDLSDVIFVKDHEGTVFARTRNNTLSLALDNHGLKVIVDLSKTASARAMYEEIKEGMYDQMSFAFIVDKDEYDKETHTRSITHIQKLFDVSAVSFPANPNTDIGTATRDYFNGVIEAERAERLAQEQSLKEVRERYYAERNKNGN